MSRFSQLSAVVAAAALCIGASSIAFAATPATKVSEAEARATALATVPGGTVQAAELETEHDKQIWSFDIKEPRSPDIVEVQIDAKSGVIVSTMRESPNEQSKESQADQKMKMKH